MQQGLGHLFSAVDSKTRDLDRLERGGLVSPENFDPLMLPDLPDGEEGAANSESSDIDLPDGEEGAANSESSDKGSQRSNIEDLFDLQSDHDGAAPPLPPPVLAPPAPVEPPPEQPAHQFYWLTRTNKQATCTVCKTKIEAQSFRVVWDPDKSQIMNPKVWSTVFWKYYHIRRRCLAACREPMNFADLPSDIASLPKRAKESVEARGDATAAALALLSEEWHASRYLDATSAGSASSKG